MESHRRTHNPRNTTAESSIWWRHQMDTFPALLAICAGNSPVTDEFPTQRPVTRSFDVLFDLRLNKRLNKQSWCWWFETPSRPLWSRCNDIPFMRIQQAHWAFAWECLNAWYIVYASHSIDIYMANMLISLDCTKSQKYNSYAFTVTSFYQWLNKANERRCYMCKVLSNWLMHISATDKERVQETVST